MKKHQTFHTERTSTDKSLDDERTKTNRSLAQAKEKAEARTDDVVQEERTHFDKANLVARKDADSRRDRDRALHSTTAESRTKTDSRTKTERERFDEATEQERSRVDDAIVREREVKSIVETKILQQERELTDKSLAYERTKTDTVVMSSNLELSKEVEEHSKTKVNLTTRDEFLAIVSHDLKNPIGTISSCMGMLLEEAVERGFDSETKGWLELAKRNADSSLRMISDILDMERIAEGKLQLSTATCEANKLIRETLDSFVHAAMSKNVLLRAIPSPLGTAVVCDHDRIIQVISNLVGNALKFTPERGKIVVKAERSAEEVTFSVCDTGPGIPKEKLEKIFEKFAQLSSKDRSGLGLGLHISKMLVEAHGGKLWVESKVGEGSTFYFSLPATQPKGNH